MWERDSGGSTVVRLGSTVVRLGGVWGLESLDGLAGDLCFGKERRGLGFAESSGCHSGTRPKGSRGTEDAEGKRDTFGIGLKKQS